jgi:acyl-CoA reductase-like NAD-dependent aldehyde dehydrogenase
MTAQTGIGARVKRKEDQRFLTGTGRYVDDLPLARATYAQFVRSPHAHAKIKSIDTSAAKAMPGVVAIFTGKDVADAKVGGLIWGGTGRPSGLDKGFFVKPTVFADVSHDMTIAREEIFGPVLSIMPYEDEDDAVRIANDTPYGLSGYVSSANLESARRVAGRLRTGMVHINNASLDAMAPFGGYKQSGNGREWGAHGMDEFLEVKSVYGYDMAS